MGLFFPSSMMCPCCSTGGYVWYLKDSKYVAKCTNCGYYFQEEDFPMCVLDSDPKPITNADRIRAMSDNELANFFDEVETDSYCGKHRGVLGWIDWLKQEVKAE